jgi:hypothetical protein
MSTAEALTFSMREEPHGIHILLWGSKDDLVRSLLIILATELNRPLYPLLVSSQQEHLDTLKRLVSTRYRLEEELSLDQDSLKQLPSQIWVLFIAQASTKTVGPWLNGWRKALSESPGTLLIVRHRDFIGLQRNAPDLISYAGPRIYDASTMLSICSAEVSQTVKTSLPPFFNTILQELPGEPPHQDELHRWVVALRTASTSK